MQFLVDTLSFRSTLSVKEIFSLFCIDDIEIPWEPGNGFNGYPNSIFYQGIKIGYGGLKGFETYVHMSGRGCRIFEDLNPVLSWESLIGKLRADDDTFHIARIDIACDEFEGFLKLDRLERYYFSGKFASRCKYVTFVKGSEEICYIGSPQSDCRLRIYNKKLERGYTEPEDLDGKPWHRAEFQFRDDVASSFCDEWLRRGDLGQTFCGKLREHCRFLTKPNDKKNSQRISEASWWVQFCQNAERIKFSTTVGSEYNAAKLHDFCFRTAASSVCTLIKAEKYTPEQLWQRFQDDSVKLRADQLAFIERSLSND